jgi:hypothetical protein
MNIDSDSQENGGKQNSTTHQKDCTTWPSQFHSRDARMLQNM